MEMDWYEAQAPDVVGRILACRVWHVGGFRDPYLHSTGVSYEWSRGPQTARCLATRPSTLSNPNPRTCRRTGGTVVQRTCGCGFWGLNNWSSLVREFGWRAMPGVGEETGGVPRAVAGLVAMWGRVVPGTQGWRAEHAEITALTSENLARRFGVAYLTDLDDGVLTSPFQARQEAS